MTIYVSKKYLSAYKIIIAYFKKQIIRISPL